MDVDRTEPRLRTADQIRAAVNRWPTWRHRIALGHGIVTPGREDSERELTRIRLPVDLRRQRVLDVGCSDGYFCFEAERRGAAEVIGVDDFTSTPHSQTECGFSIAADALGSRARLVEVSLYDLPDRDIGTFDVILFLNVLYHLRHPLLALETLARLLEPQGVLYLKTYLHRDLRLWRWGMDVTRKPILRFFPGSELNNDATNWWAPNQKCIEAMLRCAGFGHVDHLGTWGDRIYYRCMRSD